MLHSGIFAYRKITDMQLIDQSLAKREIGAIGYRGVVVHNNTASVVSGNRFGPGIDYLILFTVLPVRMLNGICIVFTG